MIYGLFGKVLLSKVRILYADIHTQPFSGPLAAFASQSLYSLKKPITQKTEKKKGWKQGDSQTSNPQMKSSAARRFSIR